MVAMNLRWHADTQVTTETIEEKAGSNPIIAYILTQKKLGTPRKVIIENLMRQKYPYRNIQTAFTILEKANSPKLDWRSPTAINDTARMIRRDMRSRPTPKISYTMGMRLLINARDNLKTFTLNPRDKRLYQINQEIKTTKKLMMDRYANPMMVQQYKIARA